MTVIAWDGKTLAADKQCTNGSTCILVTKIFRVGNDLIGITGNLSVGMEMINWFKDGALIDKFPESNRPEDRGCSLMLVKQNGEVWKYESSPYPYKVEGSFTAFGGGEESALVAMHLGATAEEAVRVTSIYNNGCGLGIDTLELLP